MIKVTIIHCWSAPRSRSTALLYSFEARGNDCVAIDEPLYRRWLVEKGDSVSRPYISELISGTPHGEFDPSDHFKWERERSTLVQRIDNAIKKLVSDGLDEGVVFIKHMAKHAFLYDFNRDQETMGNDLEDSTNGFVNTLVTSLSASEVIVRHRHLLLIRDPVAILSSWGMASDIHNNSSPDEVGIVPLLSIYSVLTSNLNSNPVVILDSDQLAADPAFSLWTVCKELDIPYKDSMLTWSSGPHLCDGAWARWWYADVHQSTGWFGHIPQLNNNVGENSDEINYPTTYAPSGRAYRTVSKDLMTALRLSVPAYQSLISLTKSYSNRGPPLEDLYEDPRNKDILVWIGTPGRGRILPRDLAAISPFDSVVQGGDATWEGLRVYNGRLLSLERHLVRLFKSAKALGFCNIHTKEEITEAIFRTLASNGMRDGVHIRLTLTRGEKCTSSMNPKFNCYGTTLIIVPEWKPVEGKTTYDNTKGITLITASTRRNSPSTCDSKIHHNNLINNILAKIQANSSNAADALMLDLDGFVSETNATNLFMVESGVLLTPSADHCLPGITRETVLLLAKELCIPTNIRRISLSEFYAADEVFTTGTMGGITPVTNIDGRSIGTGRRGVVTERLQLAYAQVSDRPDFFTAIPPFL